MNRSEELIACLEGEIVRRDARIAELTAAYTSELNELANRNYALRTENGQLHTELAALREQVPVATKLLPDVYDERDGPWFSNADIKRLSDLPAGTKLYTGPVAIAAIAERDARIAELELSEKRIYSEMLEANNSFARMFQAGAIKLTEERDQLRAMVVVGWHMPEKPHHGITTYPSVCATWHKMGAKVVPVYAAPGDGQ